MRPVFLVLFGALAIAMRAQDTTKLSQPEGWEQWSKGRVVPRGGLGVHKSVYAELGAAVHAYKGSNFVWYSRAYYFSAEFTPSFSGEHPNIYGLKTGYEIGAMPFVIGIEAKYQTSFRNDNVVLTPKAGLMVMGVVNLFYGYQITPWTDPFSNIGHHQFSIAVNLNKL